MNKIQSTLPKASITSVCTFLVIFGLNIAFHGHLSVALINSLLVFLLVIFFRFLSDSEKTKKEKYLALLPITIPLFFYNPQDLVTYLLPIVVLVSWILLAYSNYNKWFFFTGIFLIFISQLIAGGIVKIPFDIETDKLIFNTPSIQNAVEKHQQDALYFPFKLRAVIFNDLVYVYYGLTRAFDFLTLKAFYETLLLANLYPLFVGILTILKQNKTRDKFIYLNLLATLLVIAINQSPDKFISFLIVSPFLMYLIFLGFEKI